MPDPAPVTRSSGTGDSARPGRPARLPEDRTRWDARTVDARARAGWLHLVTRSVAGVTRAELSRALTEQGVLADVNRMSRWESGRQQPPVAVVRGYERTLGVQPGRLLGPTRALQRLGGDHLDGVPEEGLDALVSAALDDTAVSGDGWLRLATGLVDHDHVFLRTRDWDALTDRLVSELARSVGVAHHLRHEACLTLLHHRSSQRHLLRAVGAWVTAPDAQLVTPVVALLADVGGDTDDLVVRLLEGGDPRVAAATVPVAAARLAAGSVSPAHHAALADLAAHRLTGDATGRELADLLDLACALPAEGFDRVLQSQRDGAIRDQLLAIRSSATLLPDAAHRRVARSLGWRAQWGTEDREPPEPDPMLERLVREALFHVSGRRREQAGRLLAASPYGAVLATHVVALTDDPRDLLATRAWELLLALGHGDAHRTVLERALDPQAAHRADALLVLGLGDRPLPLPEATHLAHLARADESLRYPATLSLGLSAPATLAAVEGLDPATDRAIAWWRTAGSRVDDPPM